ncbi:hypothetical protein TrVE_jg12513 [Triparma verrucosa]|uniref:Rad60/SUMO-like domain-containing protein n=1 Tax=Triparma verrucosa TaxID=1606542 RepID=A0A9W7KUK8_9STRA|nr:hypothetical protein TrVE_jg12513 [Triparma verrucosa]
MDPESVSARKKRITATIAAYEKAFGKPCEWDYGSELPTVPTVSVASPDKGETVLLIVRDHTEEDIFIRTKKSTSMSAIFSTYATHKREYLESIGEDYYNLRFLVDGQRIGGDETPECLKLADHDVIICILTQSGC